MAKPNSNEYYYYMSDQTAYMNVETGSTTVINMRINMSYTLGQAFQISQALITARDFAWNMQDEMPSDVTLRYPYGNRDCYYEEDYKRITLSYVEASTGEDEDEQTISSYSSWDAIMHEYGHHIQYDKNITENPGGWHRSSRNMIDHYATCTDSTCDCAQPGVAQAKYAGIRIAWGEAWPTVFGIIAQKYYASRLSEIDTVNDTSYTDYDGINFDLETDGCALGEGCERAIMDVLWDLFDSGTDDDDNIALGYQKWWDVTTGGQDKTFSSFVQRFYSLYPEYMKDMGDLLTLHGMAAKELLCLSGTTELTTTAPVFLWVFQGGSSNFPNNSWDILIYDENLTTSLVVSSTTSLSSTGAMGVVSDEQWATVMSWSGEEIHVTVRSYQTDNPTTGWYIGAYKKFTKPVYKTSTTNGGIIITGTYSPLVGSITIPSTIDGKDVVGIGSSAFKNQTELTSVTLPSSIETIGDRAFQFCYQLKAVYMSSTKVSRLEAYTFDTCALNTISLPSTLTYIGEGVFIRANKPLRKLSGITYIGDYAFAYVNTENIIITSATEHIGNNAFLGCENLTIYTTNSQIASDWHSNWNASARPVVWGCSITSGYVVSFEKTSSNPSNINATNGISAPYRSGYSFDGWYTSSDFSGTAYTDITTAPNGTLYAKWTKASCVAEGTLITLADGTQKAVEELTGDEQLLVWNMLTGAFDVAPILFIDSDPVSTYQIIELSFSDGTQVKVIDEHAFWDFDLNKYVFLREDAGQYIGHWFNKQTTDEEGNLISIRVRLESVNIYTETTTAWSPVTYGHLCLYVNGMLSMPGATEAFINIFDVDPETMKYDTAKMEADIATYGLYTYEEFNALIPVPETVFNAFNGQYLKVAIGKGYTSLDEIGCLIERYSVFF